MNIPLKKKDPRKYVTRIVHDPESESLIVTYYFLFTIIFFVRFKTKRFFSIFISNFNDL